MSDKKKTQAEKAARLRKGLHHHSPDEPVEGPPVQKPGESSKAFLRRLEENMARNKGKEGDSA